jgi:glycine/D-amino acid oxidase-like deaminating enzyme
MKKDLIIVGQGICGTFLHWYLSKKGFDTVVIDEYNPAAPSRVAAGMINPVTGRRIVKSWMVDDIHPFAKEAYEDLGKELGITAIYNRNIIDFFPNPQMMITFHERSIEEPAHLRRSLKEDTYQQYFKYDFGYGEIHPCYIVNNIELFPAYRKLLESKGQLLEEKFKIENLKFEHDQVFYNDLTAERIIFCEGLDAINNQLFPNLPFANNKGQALIVEIDDLPSDKVYKKGITLAPIGEKLFWVGPSYEWNYIDDQPTSEFRIKTTEALNHMLKIPFKVVDHKSAVRPATLERRPFVGFHPANERLGMLNGMGTKGFSLAPYFANELTQHLVHQHLIHPLADLSRFEKTMARTR